MLAALAMTALLQAAAPAASYGPAAPEPVQKPVKTSAAATPAPANCASARTSGDAQDIIVCAPPGYRLNPDVLRAKKGLRSTGRPTNPHEGFKDKSCATIGPMGCRGGATINLVGAALTAATMVKRAVKGENVGAMFVTDPQPNEYALYLEAKAAREAEEAAAKEAAPAAKAKPKP
jgi:hypothetical protein